jgi:cation transport regulator ChaB
MPYKDLKELPDPVREHLPECVKNLETDFDVNLV